MHTTELQLRLLALTTSEIKAVAKTTGISERALWNIRGGKTESAREWLKELVIAAVDEVLKGRR